MMKKGASQWMKKSLEKSSQHPPEVQALLDQEQKDSELAEQISVKTNDIYAQIAKIEDWVKMSKDVDIKQLLEEQEQKADAEVPPEILDLRQNVKKRKKLLQNLRTHWWNVRELAKRGARDQGSGKDAADLRMAILNICDDALTEAGRAPGQAKDAGVDDLLAAKSGLTEESTTSVEGVA